MTDIESKVVSMVEEETGAQVSLDTDLSTLNLDSLDFVDLIRNLETAFGCTIPDKAIPTLNTVRDLVKVVAW